VQRSQEEVGDKAEGARRIQKRRRDRCLAKAEGDDSGVGGEGGPSGDGGSPNFLLDMKNYKK